jgi:hypothetical protein
MAKKKIETKIHVSTTYHAQSSCHKRQELLQATNIDVALIER